ncbi:MAG: hypothetical protein OXG81_09480 [Acidobacteria bacterium]|nr:hypothetical protein [Acidobacteriota bacterium]
MTSLAKKYDDSKLSARFTMLMGLLMSGELDGLLSMDNLRTSALAMSYVVALVAMALSVVMSLLRQGRNYLNPAEAPPEVQTGPAWHEARLFTDPWYQVPAIYCAFVLIVRLITDLIIEPPASERTVWYLVFVAFLSVVLPLSISRRVSLESADLDGVPGGRRGEKPTVAETFRDPWFTIPAMAVGAVHLARYGMEAIEEDPSSIAATLWFIAPLPAMAMASIMPSIDQLHRRRKLDNTLKPGASDVSVDAVGSGWEPP